MSTPTHAPTNAEQERLRTLDAAIDRLTSLRSKPEGWALLPRRIRRILACVADVALSAHVLSWARELAQRFDASVTLIHVSVPATIPSIYPAGPIGLGASMDIAPYDATAQREHAQRILEEARAQIAGELATEVQTLHREGLAGAEIARAAKELAIDLVVVGPHEGGFVDRLLLGSTTDHVKDHASCDVLIARGPATPGPIVAGVDGSAPSREAAALADEIARRWGTTLHLVHAVAKSWHTSADEALREELRSELVVQGTTGPAQGIEIDLQIGDARDALRLAARGAGASLLVVGTRGAGGLRSLLPGSVSEPLAHASPTSLLLVRGS